MRVNKEYNFDHVWPTLVIFMPFYVQDNKTNLTCFYFAQSSHGKSQSFSKNNIVITHKISTDIVW